MLKNYYRHGWRNLLKNKLSTLVNVGGLSIGLATGIIILLWINDEYSFDTFHKNREHIYLMMQRVQRGDGISVGDVTPGPLAARLQAQLPEIKYTARCGFGGQELIGTGSKSIYQESIYVDAHYLDMFTFPAISGNPVAALQEPDNIVLTESAASRLFGQENPMGKIVHHNGQHDLKVAAVIRDVPPNSSIHFDILLPFRLFSLSNADWIDRWDNNRLQTWVMLQPGSSLALFNQKAKAVVQQSSDEKTAELFGFPLTDRYLHNGFKNGKPSGGRVELIWLLGLIGFFILLIACINFMNLSTARSEQRAREVGVRKALGAGKSSLVLQFLVEALIITFLALVLAILLAKLAIPGLNRVSGRSIAFNFLQWKIWAGLLSLLLLTGLAAGSYPAFFLSSFQPVKVLKGNVSQQKGSGLFRKGLVTFQFIISTFLIITTIVIYKQLQHGQNRPVGYNQDNLLEIPVRGDMGSKQALLKTDLLAIPEIESVSAGTDDLLRFGGGTNGIQWPGKTPDQDFEFTVTWVQYDWVKTAGLQLAAGRDFSADYGADSLGCMVNEAAVKKMGLKPPVVGTLLGSNPIIGVVKDFVANDPFRSPPPMVIYLGKGGMGHTFVRLHKATDPQQALTKIEAAVKKNSPEFPFEFHFTKEAYQQKFNGLRSSGFMFNWTGSLAILISCLGLFGLSAFLAERRTKEIGIRKVMGASAGTIWLMLAKEFLKPVGIAFLVTVPLAIWVMHAALRSIDYRVELQWWMFGGAGLLMLVTAVGTISYQGIRAARANPVKALQAE
ncbi:ABC transporter permease [Chitinophaga sp. Ak27]|uniref:ABC transporter permease n=1 Tax=Chitinophaga sp. Ak27 TaxID=2726116 RepID=UPI00145C940C|nr:ABC transporter permease [Chitinophaga sp. Ak27]NLU95522.1 FtsX-like permease family protein [Chitinophaga sp. Ak27]